MGNLKGRKKPYIGITDFTDVKEVQMMKNLLTELAPEGGRNLMVGIMMDYKTQHGLPSKWANAWPRPYERPKIFSETEGVLNTLHYADFGGYSGYNDYMNAILTCGDHLHALQFDVPWPSVSAVLGIKEKYSHLQIILQIGKHALEELSNKNPKKVVLRMREYKDTIDFALLDLSLGKGLPLESEVIIPYLEEIQLTFPNIGLAVAGGLGPDTMYLLEPIVEQFPDISIDAQGRLRDSGNSLDPINWNRAEVYMREAVRVLKI